MTAQELKEKKPDYLYRSGVGIMLINSKKQIFVGKRIDNHSDAWQMPQGGIDVGENEDVAIFRELEEETGISESNVNIVKKSSGYYYYNLPYNLQKKFWGGKYLGQKQRWYLAKFSGEDSAINVATENPEFSHWKWIDKGEIINAIVGFKRKLYSDVIDDFIEYL